MAEIKIRENTQIQTGGYVELSEVEKKWIEEEEDLLRQVLDGLRIARGKSRLDLHDVGHRLTDGICPGRGFTRAV